MPDITMTEFTNGSGTVIMDAAASTDIPTGIVINDTTDTKMVEPSATIMPRIEYLLGAIDDIHTGELSDLFALTHPNGKSLLPQAQVAALMALADSVDNDLLPPAPWNMGLISIGFLLSNGVNGLGTWGTKDWSEWMDMADTMYPRQTTAINSATVAKEIADNTALLQRLFDTFGAGSVYDSAANAVLDTLTPGVIAGIKAANAGLIPA